jgi:hypothetical protein
MNSRPSLVRRRRIFREKPRGGVRATVLGAASGVVACIRGVFSYTLAK